MGAGCCSLGTGNPSQPDRCPSAPPHPSVASPPRFGDLCTTPGLLWAMGPSCVWCCPVRWLGSITLCDENDTVFLFPDPLVFVGSTGSSCPHGCREGSGGVRVPWAAISLGIRATGIAVHCQAAVMPGEGWWLWEPPAGFTCPALALLPRLLPGHRNSATDVDRGQSVWACAAGCWVLLCLHK